MTKDKLISLLKNPQELTVDMLPELKEVAEQYPYFAQVHQLIARILHDTGDIQAEQYVQKAALYAADSRNLYFLLHPEVTTLPGPVKIERGNRYSGNYFDMIEKVESEGGDSRQSLKSLAERLKAARESIHGTSKRDTLARTENEIPAEQPGEKPKQIYIPTPDYFQVNDYEPENKISEEYVKKLIRERKYAEAITILNELNLINPKKSIYFADQIRFLEKILVNIKK